MSVISNTNNMKKTLKKNLKAIFCFYQTRAIKGQNQATVFVFSKWCRIISGRMCVPLTFNSYSDKKVLITLTKLI